MAKNFVQAVEEMHAKMDAANLANSMAVTPMELQKQIAAGQQRLLNSLRTNPQAYEESNG